MLAFVAISYPRAAVSHISIMAKVCRAWLMPALYAASFSPGCISLPSPLAPSSVANSIYALFLSPEVGNFPISISCRVCNTVAHPTATACLVSLCWFVGRMVFEHGLEAHGTHGQDGRATTKVFERRLRWGWRWDAGWKPATRWRFEAINTYSFRVCNTVAHPTACPLLYQRTRGEAGFHGITVFAAGGNEGHFGWRRAGFSLWSHSGSWFRVTLAQSPFPCARAAESNCLYLL